GDDQPPATLEGLECAVAVATGDEHGHVVSGDGAEAGVREGEVSRDRVEDEPFAVKRHAPKMEEDRNLDELDDRLREAGYGGGEEAPDQATFCVTIHVALNGCAVCGRCRAFRR